MERQSRSVSRIPPLIHVERKLPGSQIFEVVGCIDGASALGKTGAWNRYCSLKNLADGPGNALSFTGQSFRVQLRSPRIRNYIKSCI